MKREAYPSDLTDAEWEVIAALIPPAKPGAEDEQLIYEKYSMPFSTC